MRIISVPLSEILSIVGCADDYGHGNDVLLDALGQWCTRSVTDEEIEEHCAYYRSDKARAEGYTEEDYEKQKARLTDWRDRYANGVKR